MPNIDELLQQQQPEPNSTDNVSIASESTTSTSDEKVESQSVEGYSSNMVVDLLKQSLNIHWQQTTALSAQAVHLDRWGYKKLANVLRADAEEEHRHAIVNIQRLEFFDVDYQPLVVSQPTWVRHDMVAMITYNLNSVREAAETEKSLIVAARAVGDELTANVTIPLLQGSEDGIKLYESYLKLIEQMGIDNFLTLQV